MLFRSGGDAMGAGGRRAERGDGGGAHRPVADLEAGVERGEPLVLSLERELLEETGVVTTAPPKLFGVYAHFDVFPGDHIILFVIERWRREAVPLPNNEIAEQDFFEIGALPNGVSDGSRRRLDEIFRSASQTLTW